MNELFFKVLVFLVCFFTFILGILIGRDLVILGFTGFLNISLYGVIFWFIFVLATLILITEVYKK